MQDNQAYSTANVHNMDVPYEEISPNNMNEQVDETNIFYTKANEAYQTNAASIESKNNEAYGIYRVES